MKKITAAMLLTAALSAGVTAFAQTGTNPTGQVDPATSQTQNQKPAELKDVPAGHWASAAIQVAANCGIIRGFPDGTFRGNEPVSRYQAAAIIARLLDAVRNGECGIPKYATKAELDAALAAAAANGTVIDTSKFLTAEDLVVLQNAIQELAADLAQLGVRVAELEDNAVTADDLARVEEIATQARDLAEAAAGAAQEANDNATAANDAAAGAQQTADAAGEAADAANAAAAAAQQTADDALAAAAAAQQSADDAAAAIEAVQSSEDAINAAANAQQTADDAMATAMEAQESADAAAAAAEAAQQSADDALAAIDEALAAAAAAQQTADDALAAISAIDSSGVEAAQQTADDALDVAANAQQSADDAINAAAEALEAADAATAAAEVAQQTADDALALAQEAQPAGDYATNEDLAGVAETANQARDLAEAVAAAFEDQTGLDPEAFAGLADQVEASSIAADTALAQARELQDRFDELNGRVDDLESQLGELGATVEGQADSIAALNDLVVLLNQDVLSLQDRVTQLERGLAESGAAVDDLAANAASQEDLESLREFTTLLRRDQTALADRVGEVEARVAAVENRVTAIDGRVAALEANAFTVSGSISFNYYTARVWREGGLGAGFAFDIDRLGFGTVFSTGENSYNGDDSNRDYSDFGAGFATASADEAVGGAPAAIAVGTSGQSGARVNVEGAFRPSITTTFTFKPRNLLGATTNTVGNTFPNFTLAVTFRTTLTTRFSSPTPNSAAGSYDPSVRISAFALTYDVGAAPLMFKIGRNPAFKFNSYAFNNAGDNNGRGDGFVASLNGAGILPGNAALTVVYGSQNGAGDDNADFYPFLSSNDNDDNVYFMGIRGTASLIPGFTGGVYFGYEGSDVLAGQSFLNTNYGVDFGGKLFGFVDLTGEWNASSTVVNGGASVDKVASFVQAGVAIGPFTVGGNWRHINAAYDGNSQNGGPYNAGQGGFGFNAAATLGIFTAGAYFDSRGRVDAPSVELSEGPTGRFKANKSGANTSGDTVFGINVGLRLIGFDLTAALDNGAEVNGAAALRNDSYLGFDAAHDGSKSDALIGGFNLRVGFNTETNAVIPAPAANTTTTNLYAYAGLSKGLDLAGFTIDPEVYFHTRNISVSAPASALTITNFGAGVKAEGGFLFGSKLAMEVAYDSASYTDGKPDSSTFLARVGLNFNPALFGAPSTFGITFAIRDDKRRDGRGFGPGFGNQGSIGSWGGDDLTAGALLAGLYLTFDYYGLSFGYGIFNHYNYAAPLAGNAATTWGQGFRIGYSLKF